MALLTRDRVNAELQTVAGSRSSRGSVVTLNRYEAFEVEAACPLTPALSPGGGEGESKPVVVTIAKMKNSPFKSGYERNHNGSGSDCLRACLKTTRGAAAKDFGCGQAGEVGASPQRAVTTGPTRVTGKRPAARRVFSKRPSGFVAPQSKIHEGYSLVPVRKHSRLAIRPFAGKQPPRVDFKRALRQYN